MQSDCRRTGRLIPWIAILIFSCLSGCEKQDQIRRYQVTRDNRPAEVQSTVPEPPGGPESEKAEETPAPAGSVAPNSAVATAPSTGGLQYELPDGWTPGKVSAMRLAAFNIQRNEKQAEVTVIRLGPVAGSLLDNVNRWRGQIGLDPIGQAELDASVEKLDVAGMECSYVRIVSPDGVEAKPTILAVVIPRPDQTLFVKLLGDRGLAAEEQTKFEQFVRSIRFAATP